MSSEDNQNRSLGQRVTLGASWLIFTRLALRSLGLISTIVLARLLLPEDFGLIAMATAFLGMVQGISNLGFHTALIRFQSDIRQDYDTAWTLNVIRGVILSAGLAAAAPAIAGYFGDGRLEMIIYVLALQPLFSGFSNPRFIEFERDLDFSKNFVLMVVAKSLAVVTTITVAIIWRNYWAIIGGLMVGSMVRFVLSYTLHDFRPRIDFSSTRKLFSFAIWITGANVINSISHNVDRLLSGRFLGATLAGHYYMGLEISSLLTRELFDPLARALYPGFAKVSDNLAKLRSNTLETIGVFASLGLPIGIGFAFVAEEFVLLVLGQKWEMIIPIIQVLAPILGIQTISNVANGVMMSLGEPHAIFYRSMINFGLRLPLLVYGVLNYGLVGLFIAHAASDVIYFALNYVMLVRRLECRAFDPLRAARRGITSVSAMVIVLGGVIFWLPDASELGLWMIAILLFAKAGLGALVYTGCHIWLWQRAGQPGGIERRALEAMPERITQYIPKHLLPHK